MVALSGPDHAREHHNLMSFQRFSRMANTSRTVARKLLRRSVTIPFVTPVRDLAPVEEYVSMVIPSFSLTDFDSPDVHRKYDGKCRRSSRNDASRGFFLPCRV